MHKKERKKSSFGSMSLYSNILNGVKKVTGIFQFNPKPQTISPNMTKTLLNIYNNSPRIWA
jgi:hypothetical protein